MVFSKYTNKTKNQIYNDFRTSALGLSKKEAAARLIEYGPNEINKSRNIFWELLIRQLRSPFFYLLFIAGAISLFIGERVDSIVIFCFVFVNLALGYFQEYRAERAITLLAKFVSFKAKVLRAGRKEIIDKKMLVPGDIAIFEAGDIAPADIRLIKAEGILADESVLSGEAVPVTKITNAIRAPIKEIFDADNILFAGTSIVAGKGQGVIVGT